MAATHVHLLVTLFVLSALPVPPSAAQASDSMDEPSAIDADRQLSNNSFWKNETEAMDKEREYHPWLPNCIQTTISRPLDGEQWQNRSNSMELNVCWPLSPQLLNCPLRRHDAANYTIVNHTLVDNGTGLSATLGDYYVDAGSAAHEAYTCNESIVNERNLPRCHYLMASKGDHEIRADGSVHVYSANVTVRRPSLYTTYDKSTGTLNLCVPLNIDVFTCILWITTVPDFKILQNKKLYYLPHQATFDYEDYLPYVYEGDADYAICALEPPYAPYDAFYVFTGLHIASCVCLAVTVVVQLMVVKPTCYSKSILCYVISMMAFYVDMTGRKLVDPMAIDRTLCYVFFVFNYYFSMAAFLWLNMLSLDVCLFFAGQIGDCIAKNRFACYSTLSWGIPSALLTVALLVDQMKNLQAATQLYPRIEEACWFNERPSNWAFYYGPLSVIMGCNLVFFVLTVIAIRRSSQGTEMANRNRNRQLFHVCIKLFIVMGLCWTLEIVFWLIEDNEYWYVPEAVTSVQGIAVFAVYICKRRTYGLLRAKLCRRNAQGPPTGHPARKASNRDSIDTIVSNLSFQEKSTAIRRQTIMS